MEAIFSEPKGMLADRWVMIKHRGRRGMPQEFPTPSWVHDAVFYQIFPERFANGDTQNDPPDTVPWASPPGPDTFMGGDLKGLLEHLDYLANLGISAIYLNPIFSAQSNHKFDHRDYKQVDPHFGSNQLLKVLVDECHSKGIRVILDISQNHCGRDFFAFADVVQKGAASKYTQWYHIESFPVSGPEKPNYKSWWGIGSLPEFNNENQEVRAYFWDVTRYWMEEVGVDGWRLDVANEVSHEYWCEWRALVKGINPDAYIVGEIWGDGTPWLQGDNFDAVMNYVWRDLVVDFFAERSMTASKFDAGVRGLLARHPASVNLAMFNLIGSHDTARFLTVAQERIERLRLAFLYQMTYVGAPVIYYGDEIGMRGEKDPGCRGAMVWDRGYWNSALQAYVAKLIEIRRGNPSLRSGEYHRVLTHDEHGVYVYRRGRGQEAIYVVLNNSGKDRAVAFCPEQWPDTSEAIDLIKADRFSVTDGMISGEVGAWEGLILRADK